MCLANNSIFFFILFLGETSLFYAISGGHIEAVKLLLNHGADVNTKDKYGEKSLIE